MTAATLLFLTLGLGFTLASIFYVNRRVGLEAKIRDMYLDSVRNGMENLWMENAQLWKRIESFSETQEKPKE